MRNSFALILGVIIGFSSCEKPKTNYEQGTAVTTSPDTTTWEDTYVDGGVLTNNIIGSADTTMLGTIWVITKVNTGFTNTQPNDTIWFDTNTSYRVALGIGGGFGSPRAYKYSSLPLTNNVQLVMNYWVSLSGSHYSGEFGGMSITDGIINSATFVDNQAVTSKYLVWMKKL
jgi:hypothetical protein|tara:strand:+ start:35133 stop:35648 length:516 start_codon:yes stop_codon:yes gene_type:complete